MAKDVRVIQAVALQRHANEDLSERGLARDGFHESSDPTETRALVDGILDRELPRYREALRRLGD